MWGEKPETPTAPAGQDYTGHLEQGPAHKQVLSNYELQLLLLLSLSLLSRQVILGLS